MRMTNIECAAAPFQALLRNAPQGEDKDKFHLILRCPAQPGLEGCAA
jgi:hypothetical protein